VARSPYEVRLAVPADSELLLALQARMRTGDGPHPHREPHRERPGTARERLTGALSREDVEVHVAVAGGEVVGLLVLRLAELVALTAGGAVHIEQLWVDPSWRHRGVARALLTGAAATAERLGVEDIACSVPPVGRDVHRFFARLGFGPAVMIRMVPVARLRTRLGNRDDGGRRAALDQLLARRRRQFAHPVSAEAPRAAGS
jgi:ribosomal protein S18 acetylase RimI-like enzyme